MRQPLLMSLHLTALFTDTHRDKLTDIQIDKYDLKAQHSPCAHSLIASPFGLAIISLICEISTRLMQTSRIQ
uniref:Uncharacterized protein n=1 Tax=Hyaloperonospora arabidopsidis (strain Emoy2) TaxID=559515 RepID=M4BUK5_HYAAE